MRRGAATGLTLLYVSGFCAAGLLAAAPAGAVVIGSLSSLDHFIVRLVGRGHCSGVAIARRAVVTASHCARYGIRVITGNGSLRVVGSCAASSSTTAAALTPPATRCSCCWPSRCPRASARRRSAAAAATVSPSPATAPPMNAANGQPSDPLHEARLVSARRRTARRSQRIPASSAPAPATAIPAARCCAAACWSASSPAPPIRTSASPAATTRAGRRSASPAVPVRPLRRSTTARPFMPAATRASTAVTSSAAALTAAPVTRGARASTKPRWNRSIGSAEPSAEN